MEQIVSEGETSGQSDKSPTHYQKPIHPVLGSYGLVRKSLEAHYEVKEVLGRGSSGLVRRCVEKSSGRTLACKSILEPNSVFPHENQTAMEKVTREISILLSLTGQPNLVQFHEAFEDDGYAHIVMEFCSGGELSVGIPYSERHAAGIFAQIMRAIQQCHSSRVIHGDVKPQNILSCEGTMKAVDFGDSRFMGDEGSTAFNYPIGTIGDFAPELRHFLFGKEVDIWRAGIVLCMLLTGAPLDRLVFPVGEHDSAVDLFYSIPSTRIDFDEEPWPSISNGAKDLVERLLEPKRGARITAAQSTHGSRDRWKEPRFDGGTMDSVLWCKVAGQWYEVAEQVEAFVLN